MKIIMDTSKNLIEEALEPGDENCSNVDMFTDKLNMFTCAIAANIVLYSRTTEQMKELTVVAQEHLQEMVDSMIATIEDPSDEKVDLAESIPDLFSILSKKNGSKQ